MERQREDGRKLIELRGWDLAREYVDNDTSAAGRKPRPQFDALLEAVEVGEISVVVAYSLDRLTRNRRDQLRLIETCQHRRTLIALVRGSDVDLSSAVGRAMADMMAVWGRMEIEQKSERQVRAIQQAAEAGRMVGGRRAFGYSPDGLELDEVEAPLVVGLYERFLAGSTLSELARWLNDEIGVTTPRGLRWTVPSLRFVLSNPRNAGRRGIRRVVNPSSGQRDTWHDVVGAAVWPPIVKIETWEATVAMLRDPSRPGRRNNAQGGNAPRYLLTNIAKCGDCGAGMVNSYTDKIRILRCRFGHHSRRADHIEGYVQEILLRGLVERDEQDLLRPRDPGVDVEAAKSEAATLRARLSGLAADYSDGVLDREQMRVASGRIRSRLSELGIALAEAGRVDPVESLVHAGRRGEDPTTLWESYSLGVRRAVVDRLLAVRVLRGNPGSRGRVFDPDTVDVRWR